MRDDTVRNIPSKTSDGMKLTYKDRRDAARALTIMGNLNGLLYRCSPQTRIWLRRWLKDEDPDFVTVIDSRLVDIDTDEYPVDAVASSVDAHYQFHGFRMVSYEQREDTDE